MVECKSLKSYQLKPWLDEQAALRGCRFDYEASQTIMEYLSVTDNAPLLLLEQESKNYRFTPVNVSFGRKMISSRLSLRCLKFRALRC